MLMWMWRNQREPLYTIGGIVTWNSGHLMRRVNSLEKILMRGKIEGRRRRGWKRMRWLDGITDSMDMNLRNSRRQWRTGKPACCSSWSHKGVTWLGTWTINNNNSHYGKQNERSSKIKNRTTIWSSNFISGDKSKENENTNSERYLQPHVHSNIIYNSQDKETTYSTDNEWIKKLWYIYTMEYYSAIKRRKILPFATTWMDLEGIMLNKMSDKDKYYISLAHEI